VPDYSSVTQEEFDEKLEEILGRMSVDQLMAIPGFYEIVREELNNEVLEALRPEEDEKQVLDDDDDECDG
jgi:hypothetical protein